MEKLRATELNNNYYPYTEVILHDRSPQLFHKFSELLRITPYNHAFWTSLSTLKDANIQGGMRGIHQITTVFKTMGMIRGRLRGKDLLLSQLLEQTLCRLLSSLRSN